MRECSRGVCRQKLATCPLPLHGSLFSAALAGIGQLHGLLHRGHEME